MNRKNFIYANVPEAEEKMFSEVTAFLKESNLSDKIAKKVILAISEAFTNALVHGNKWDYDKTIEVVLAINDREIRADIIDEGNCDLSLLQNRPQPGLLSEGGRGMDIIESLTDEVNYSINQRTGGLMVSMVFHTELMEKKSMLIERRK